MEQQNEEMEIDLMEIFYVLKSRILVILLTAGFFALVVGLSTYYFVKPMYSSTSSVYVLSSSSDIGSISISDLQVGKSLTSDYIEMIKSPTVLDKVISNLGMGNELSYKGLLSCVSVDNPSDTRILNLTVKYGDPRVAKALVDELAEVSRERISEIMDMQKPNIFEEGKVDVAPISPNVKRYTIFGALIGFLLASAVIIITHLMDDTIHSSEDIEKYLNLNTLAAIPVSEGSEVEIRRDDRKRRKGDSMFTIVKRHFTKSKHHGSDK